MKKCKICENVLPEERFYFRKAKNGKIYASSYCKECERESSKKAKKDRYHDPIKGKNMKERAASRASTAEYKIKKNLGFRTKYKTNIEFRKSILDRLRDLRSDPQKHAVIRKRAAKYYQTHKQEIQHKLLLSKNSNPKAKIRGYMRSRISEALKKAGSSKAGVASLAYLPYSWDGLCEHLKSKFEEWMNFSNYGPAQSGVRTWQVDHIIPQSFFPYDSMDSDLFRMCWDLRNLRPYDSVLNAMDDNRTDLLGESRSIYDLFAEIRSSNPIEQKETIDDIITTSQKIKPITQACPMSMIGLNYLDSVFTARFDSKTQRFPSLNQAMMDNDKLYEAIIHLIKKGECVTPHTIYSALRFRVRTPGHFFPMAALSIILRYAAQGKVFDPFLGWGGRCLAALCSDIISYEGCDLQSEVIDGCRHISKDFALCNKITKFHLTDSLNFMYNCTEKFNLIFTSPPFMDTEDYGIESDSMRANWIDDFVFPLVEQLKYHLEPNGYVALHLKDIKGAPTFTAYHSAMKALGFKQIARHKYGRNWTQSVYVYSLVQEG